MKKTEIRLRFIKSKHETYGFDRLIAMPIPDNIIKQLRELCIKSSDDTIFIFSSKKDFITSKELIEKMDNAETCNSNL